jgi:hypothetical protein
MKHIKQVLLIYVMESVQSLEWQVLMGVNLIEFVS